MVNLNWNFNDTQEASESVRLQPGGYVCMITKVENDPSRELLKIYFDIAEGPHKKHFSQLQQNPKFNGNWPGDGIMVRSYKPGAASFFKAFINRVAESNPGYQWNGDEQALVRRGIGFVLGEEDYQANDGTIKTRLRVQKVTTCKAIRAGDFTVPEKKPLRQPAGSHAGYGPGYGAPPPAGADPNQMVPVLDDDDLPF